MDQIAQDLQLNPSALVAMSSGFSWRALAERLGQYLAHAEQLSKWIGYRDCDLRAESLGLTELSRRLADGRLPPAEASTTLAMAYYGALLREQFRQSPALAHFEGQIHQRAVQRFTTLDRERIAASALELMHAHHRRIPAGGGVGPVGVLRAEIAKKTRHMPIRELMTKAAPAIQALKPVLMMSPLSVAQFLPPGKLTFDLLVMDEAS